MALFIINKFFDQFFGRPVRQMIRDLEIMLVGREQGRLEHFVISCHEHHWIGVRIAYCFDENFTDVFTDVFMRPKGGEFAATFAEETGMARGFPGVLADQILQLRFSHPVDEGGDGA